jgi:hypothetical protein
MSRERGRGPAVHRRRCRREHDPAVDRGGTTPGRAPAASPLQPARSYTTAALNASGRCETGGSSGVAATVGHAQTLALRWPSWRARAAPRGDHRLRLSRHGRPCARILAGVVGEGDSPGRFQDLSQPVAQPARVVKPDQGAAHAFALRGRPAGLPGRLVRPAAVTFWPRVRRPRPRLVLRTPGLGAQPSIQHGK